jgi:hypothetical protein
MAFKKYSKATPPGRISRAGNKQEFYFDKLSFIMLMLLLS